MSGGTVTMKVGTAYAADAPRLDRGKHRMAARHDLHSGDTVHSVLEERWNRTKSDFTHVGLGIQHNAVIKKRTCDCGKAIIEVVADRAIKKHVEILISSLGHSTEGSKLVVTFDGGGGGPGEADGVFGAGCAVFIYKHGVPTLIKQCPVICQASTAQQAEAAGARAGTRIIQESLRTVHESGLRPTPPHILAGDSANTIGFFLGVSKIRASQLQTWFVGHSEREVTTTIQVAPMHIPRSNNRAADRMATLAVKILAGQDAIASAPIREHTDASDISIIPMGDKDLLVYNSDLEGRRCSQIEQSGWDRRLDEITGWGAAGRPWRADGGMKYQWSTLKIHLSHAAYVAAAYYDTHLGNNAPRRLIQAIEETIRHTRGGQTYLFIWYATNSPDRGGRAWERSPGLQGIPGRFRYALLGHDHNEYDMDLAHPHIYLVFAGELTPCLRDIVTQMADPEEKRRLSAMIPGTHKILGTALGLKDPFHPMAHTKLALDAHGGPAPGWFLEILREIRTHGPTIKRRIMTHIGIDGSLYEQVTMASLLQDLESRVINLSLDILRRKWDRVFSHAIVHDALFIEKTVDEVNVSDSFQTAARTLGLVPLSISRKSWDTAKEKFQELLDSMQPPYDPHSRVSSVRIKHPSRKPYGQQSMLRYLGKYAKAEYDL